MSNTFPQNIPPTSAPAAQISLGEGAERYAKVAGTGYSKYDVLLVSPKINTTTGLSIGDVWYNKNTKTVIAAAPPALDVAVIPSGRTIDLGDPVVVTIPDTVGGTGLGLTGALADANYVELGIAFDQLDGVNYSISAAAPVIGAANGQLELTPGSTGQIVSGADLVNLKFIAKVAAGSVKITAAAFYKLPEV
jgi:hypothetical protein